MLNIHDLERRWIKYKIKSVLPFIFSTVVIVLIVVAAFFYIPTSDVQEKATQVVSKVNTTVQVENVQPQTKQSDFQEPPASVELEVPQNTQVPAPINVDKDTSLVLKPSLRFMDNIEDGLSSYVQDQYQAPHNIPNQYNTLGYQSEQTLVEQPEETPEVEEQKLTLTVTTEKNDDDLKDVIRRFKKNKNPTLSLFIAKHYYNAGNYQKSYNYALMTNEIDKSIDESWIIFSKSLVKLGQHELAVNTLKSYLKTTKSSAADVLLRKIQSGQFK